MAITGARPELKGAIREAAMKSCPQRIIDGEVHALLERQYGVVADVLAQISENREKIPEGNNECVRQVP